jgi:tRNA wybutosine-synthesizing protein 4
MNAQDQAVMMTSGDAVETKAYAASKGYFNDEFVAMFAKGKKFMPIINRGTWARVQGVRQVIQRFLGAYESDQKVNILSLGAGYDSTYFWLKKNMPELAERLTYIEIDFEKVVKQKTSTIKKRPELSSLIAWRET